LSNARLAEHGNDERVDHRSLEAQGIDREPTIHLGPAVSSMERRGIRTDVGYRLQEEASARLERAAELASLENEGREVEQSVLSLNLGISAALAARDAEEAARAGETLEQEASTGAQCRARADEGQVQEAHAGR
jgi:hypothetical protein